MAEQPTPEQLVDRLRNLGATDDEQHRNMAGIIADAEAGGEEHMAAVADFICSLPPAPPDPSTSVYEQRNGTFRPAFHDTNVLLELQAKVGRRTFVAREAIDPSMFDARFAAGDGDEFERFIRHFIGRNFGQVAVCDDESYRYFRNLLWVVRPTDAHDLKRCAGGRVRDPLCDAGLIIRAPSFTFTVPDVIEPSVLPPDVLGVCPCRCHRNDGSGERAGQLAAMYLIRTFDESQLDEPGEVR